VQVHQFLAYGKTKPGSFGFSGKKWFEKPLNVFLFYACAVVLDYYYNIFCAVKRAGYF